LVIGRDKRLLYKAALIDGLSTQESAFHIVAELPPGASHDALEDSLYAWKGHVDHYYLGRSWARAHQRANRMSGVVFFETGRGGGHPHAHLIAVPPKPASRLHFLLWARFFFQPHPEKCLRRCYPKPIASRGKMHIERIGPTPSDRRRVLNYVAKELERSEKAITAWKFLDQLSPRHV
jgi:hypothetical protein